MPNSARNPRLPQGQRYREFKTFLDGHGIHHQIFEHHYRFRDYSRHRTASPGHIFRFGETFLRSFKPQRFGNFSVALSSNVYESPVCLALGYGANARRLFSIQLGFDGGKAGKGRILVIESIKSALNPARLNAPARGDRKAVLVPKLLRGRHGTQRELLTAMDSRLAEFEASHGPAANFLLKVAEDTARSNGYSKVCIRHPDAIEWIAKKPEGTPDERAAKRRMRQFYTAVANALEYKRSGGFFVKVLAPKKRP